MNQYGSPTILEIFLCVVGTLLAVGALAHRVRRSVHRFPPGRRRPVAASMAHVVATLGNLLLTYAVLVALNPELPANWGFRVVGFEGTFAYNAMLLLEAWFVRLATSTVRSAEVGS